MVKLMPCDRDNLSVKDWYLYYDELQKIWHTGQFFISLDKSRMIQLADGAILDIGWCAKKGYRIIHT